MVQAPRPRFRVPRETLARLPAPIGPCREARPCRPKRAPIAAADEGQNRLPTTSPRAPGLADDGRAGRPAPARHSQLPQRFRPARLVNSYALQSLNIHIDMWPIKIKVRIFSTLRMHWMYNPERYLNTYEVVETVTDPRAHRPRGGVFPGRAEAKAPGTRHKRHASNSFERSEGTWTGQARGRRRVCSARG